MKHDTRTLGIDIGSTEIRIALSKSFNGQAEIVFKQTLAPDFVRSLLREPEGTIRLTAQDVGQIKSSMGRSSSSESVSEKKIYAGNFYTALFRKILEFSKHEGGWSFDKVVLAIPSDLDVLSHDHYRNAAENAGYASVETVTDAMAVLQCLQHREGFDSRSAMVCDIGEYRTRISSHSHLPAIGFSNNASPRIVEQTGCSVMDRAIYSDCVPMTNVDGILQLEDSHLVWCKQLRESLAKADPTTVTLPHSSDKKIFERSWLRSICKPILEKIARAIVEMEREAGALGCPPDTLVLCGGGSLLPFVVEELKNCTSCKIVVPRFASNTVALGSVYANDKMPCTQQQINPYSTPEFRAFLQEYERRARSRRLTFLLAGRTGVGKSSTVNSLLGQVVAPVNHFEPCTFQVMPYDTDVEGVPIRIVDTPGLCDKPVEDGNDELYIKRMRESVVEIDSLWFVTEFHQTRPPGTDELRAIRVLSKAFEKKADVWKSAVIVLTNANCKSVPDAIYEEKIKRMSKFLRDAIAVHAGREIADGIPVVPVENTSDKTRDGLEWRGVLYTKVCLTVSKDGFASWIFATIKDVEVQLAPGRQKVFDLTEDDDNRRGRRIRVNAESAEEIRERIRADVIGRYENYGKSIGSSIGGVFGSGGASTGASIGGAIGRAAGRFVDWLFG